MEAKTPMHELIETLQNIKDGLCGSEIEIKFFNGVLALIESGKYLEKEKQVIIEAYDKGWDVAFSISYPEILIPTKTSEEYYNETFKP